MSIKYPFKFIKEIKKSYADKPNICKLAENGRYVLGKYLAVYSSMQLSPEEILEAFNSNKQHVILEHAEITIRRREIYKNWLQLVTKKLRNLEHKTFSAPSPPLTFTEMKNKGNGSSNRIKLDSFDAKISENVT
jgi:hypothetical protein